MNEPQHVARSAVLAPDVRHVPSGAFSAKGVDEGGVKGGAYLRFFGGPSADPPIPLLQP
jgi:hypothetical protein